MNVGVRSIPALRPTFSVGYGNIKNDSAESFTKRYGIHTLVWYESHETMESAIAREKSIKSWRRVWKLELIEKGNPTWRDLYEDIA